MAGGAPAGHLEQPAGPDSGEALQGEHKAAISRIWERIQGLGVAANPEADKPEPKAEQKAKAGAQAAKGAPAKGKATKTATAAKNAPKAKKAAKAKETAEPREGSKTAQVVAMLQRKGGATLAEIMDKMGWQRHYADVRIMPTCVGNLAGGTGIAAMKSA